MHNQAKQNKQEIVQSIHHSSQLLLIYIRNMKNSVILSLGRIRTLVQLVVHT